MYCQQEKKPPRKVFLYQVQTDTLFHNGTAAKRPPEQVQQTFESTGAACWFCFVTIKRDRTCASSGWKSQTEVKTKRQNYLRHANKLKKRKRNENRFLKITSWGNLKFRSCSQPQLNRSIPEKHFAGQREQKLL